MARSPALYAAFLFALSTALSCVSSACKYTGPACQTIKAANDACGILVELPDGSQVQVPHEQLVQMARINKARAEASASPAPSGSASAR